MHTHYLNQIFTAAPSPSDSPCQRGGFVGDGHQGKAPRQHPTGRHVRRITPEVGVIHRHAAVLQEIDALSNKARRAPYTISLSEAI